jgi:hypothetical protein
MMNLQSQEVSFGNEKHKIEGENPDSGFEKKQKPFS